MESKLKRKAAEAYAIQVRERYNDKIERIILYGSVARNEDIENSDIDILVIAKNADFQLQRELSFLAFDIGMEHGVEISVQVYSTSHFQNYAHFSFFENVNQEGIALG